MKMSGFLRKALERMMGNGSLLCRGTAKQTTSTSLIRLLETQIECERPWTFLLALLNPLSTTRLEEKGKSDLESKIEQTLKEGGLLTSDDLRKKEEEILSKLNPKDARQKYNNLVKERNLAFYQEVKNKRISKIKSKLYHKIKKKVNKKLS